MEIKDLSGISQPATELIKRISDALGSLLQPWQMRRIARAQTDVDQIMAESQIKISEIEQRGINRLIKEEGRRQNNIESITAQALPLLSPDARPDEVDIDWIVHFFDRCRLVSDIEMQTVWANLLAGESNNPKQFSKRTIDLISTLDKTDAEIFTKICPFIWKIGNEPFLIIPDVNESDYMKSGIDYSAMKHLEDIGLLSISTISPYGYRGITPTTSISYFDKRCSVWAGAAGQSLSLGSALLSRSGQQLSRLVSCEPSEQYYVSIVAEWHRRGHFVKKL